MLAKASKGVSSTLCSSGWGSEGVFEAGDFFFVILSLLSVDGAQ